MRRHSYANIVTGSDNVDNIPGGSGGNVVANEDVLAPKSSDNGELDVVNSNQHLLFLQNIDHPGLVLISKKLTGTENYGPWKRSLTIDLSAKNKLGLINGTCLKPDDDSPLRAQWERVNDLVISWILNTISEDISNGMDFVNTAQEVWEELFDQFSSIDGHRVYHILKDLHALEQGDKSVEFYYHKMKNLWDEYTALEPAITCKCNCKCDSHKLLDDREQMKRLLQFLMGLNDSFSAGRGQILMMNPLPSIAQAFSLVKQEEKQRQAHSLSNSFVGNVGNVRTAISGTKPVVSNSTSVNFDAKKQILKCAYCHKDGHTKETCFKLIGYPPRGRGRGKPYSQATSQGFRFHPQPVTPPAQAASQAVKASCVGFSKPTDIGASVNSLNSPSSQVSLEQLQQQMTRISQMMSTIAGANCSTITHEDHVSNLAGSGPDAHFGNWC